MLPRAFALLALATLLAVPAASADTGVAVEPVYCGPGGDTHVHAWTHPYGLHAHATVSVDPLGDALPVEACVAAGADVDPPVPLPPLPP